MREIKLILFSVLVVVALSASKCIKNGSTSGGPGVDDPQVASVDATALPIPPCVGSGSGGSADGVVAPGTYCVCDGGPLGDQVHPDKLVRGRHLRVGETVVIGAPGTPTSVRLGPNDFTFQTSEDGKKLTARINYQHTAIVSGEAGIGETHTHPMVTHLVKVSRAPDYKEPADPLLPKCDKFNKHVIRVEFCLRDDQGQQWLCSGDRPNLHLGDVHAQD